ncbi:MAG: SBBP repeat-containing protein [Vicingus serpentipes]|nr:SBBP repeat-containing protein [Vicingus serpentipes]
MKTISPFLLFFKIVVLITLLFTIATQLKAKENLPNNKLSDAELKAKASKYISEQKSSGFMENLGQMMDTEGKSVPFVLFKAEATNLNFWITKTGITLQTLKHEESENHEQGDNILTESGVEDKERKLYWERIDIELKGAIIKKENIIKEGVSSEDFNFFYHTCPDGIYGVKQYSKVTIKEVYPGIDWVLYRTKDDGFKYDFVVHSGANYKQIELIYKSKTPISINEQGQLEMYTLYGNLKENTPVSFYESQEVVTQFVQNYQQPIKVNNDNGYETSISFQLPTFKNENSEILIIDPQLVWGTFYGGSNYDTFRSVNCDKSGNVLVTGSSTSSDFPVFNPGSGAFFQSTIINNPFGPARADVVILKFSNTGVRLWSTYYGGQMTDNGFSIATDNNGNIFVTGEHSGNWGFPLFNPLTTAYFFSPTSGGDGQFFILKFTPTGQRLWATSYVGANSGLSLNVDVFGNVFVTGRVGFGLALFNSVIGSYSQTSAGWIDSYILKFNNDGMLLWATYLGGASGYNYSQSITTDVSGNVVVTGRTNSLSFPTLNPLYATNSGKYDVFITKFDNDGVMLWSTYYGGSFNDDGYSVITDSFENIFITGYTDSGNFPTKDIGGTAYFQPVGIGGGLFPGEIGGDAFILKINSAGNNLLWGTFFGGAGRDNQTGIQSFHQLALDNCNNIYVVVMSGDGDLPSQTPCDGGWFKNTFASYTTDIFISKFSNVGVYLWGSYLGGNGQNRYGAVAVDSLNNIFMVGEWGISPNLVPPWPLNNASYPLANPGLSAYYDGTYNGYPDGFVVKFIPNPPVHTPSSVNSTSCAPCNGSAKVTITNGCLPFSYVWSNGIQALDTNISTHTITGLCPGNYWVEVTSNCNQTDTVLYTITGVPCVNCVNPPVLSLSNQTDETCSQTNGSITVAVNGGTGTAPFGYAWNNGDTIPTISNLAAGNYQVIVTDAGGCKDTLDVTITNTGSPASTTENNNVCSGDNYTYPDGTVSNNITVNESHISNLTTTLGCDSIVTTNLTVNPITNGTDIITDCNPILWIDGNTYSASNNTATHTLVGGAANGCDSIVTLDFTLNNTTSGTDVIVACGPITWLDGNTYSSNNNTATHTLVGGAANGCDSIVTLDFTLNSPTNGTDVISSCGPIIWLDGNTYSANNNTAMHTLVGGAANGCDSIVTLDFTLNSAANGTDVITGCNPIVWIDGNTYSASNNTATHTLVGGAANGCDSIVTLNFTLNNTTSGTDVIVACGPITWLDGNTYSSNNNTAIHTLVGGAASGCDSTVTLNFTLNTFASGTDVITDCNPIVWLDGNTYSASNNTATHTLVGGSINGCDSIVTLNFTLNSTTTGTDVITDCNPIVWLDGNTYSASNNTATHTIVGGSVNGCDSIVTLDFTLNNATTGTDVITDCNPIVWIDGNTYSTTNNTATHTLVGGASNGCDSVVTLNFTLNNATNGTDAITDCNPIVWIDGNTYSANNNTATHTLVGGASNGCDSIVTLNFTLNNPTTSTDIISSCGPIVWLDGNTYSSNNNTSTHTIIGGAANGCDSTITLNFTLNTFASGTDVITDCNPIVWIDGNTYSATNNAATHTIVGGSVNGCDSIVTLNFTLKNATNGTDIQTICNNYLWIDGNTYTSSNNTATHTITAGATNGCDSIVTLNLTIIPCNPPQGNYTVSDSSICPGQCVDFTDLSSGATTWQWTFNGATPSTSTNQHPTDICFKTTGNYTITQIVSNTYGADTTTSTITVNANPIINAGNDPTIKQGESTPLPTTGSTGTYRWIPSTGLDCSNCPNPIASPEETITYTVIVVDSNGCQATDKVTVIVNYQTVIYVPNIFSPNGDGNNDVLYVRGKGIRDFNFVVYDRWGEKVFETTDLNKGWNGVFRGEPMNKAVFVYYLQGTFVDGSEFNQKGDVTLIR